MRKEFLIAINVTLFTLFLTGIVYPLLINGIANIFFKDRAGGSLIYNKANQIQGSLLVGQNFKNPAYFFSRPSAAGKGYDSMFSQGSNLGPTSQRLLDRVEKDVSRLKVSKELPIPIDLVTASGSGLDPHISPGSAYWQASRVAHARDVSLQRVVSLVDDLTEYPQFYFMGQPRVNVLKLNKALDKFFGNQGKR